MKLRAPWAIALAALLTYALTGGGRISGSDEVTQLQLARAMSHGSIEVPEGWATMPGHDGRIYTKNTWGQALLAFPLVLAGDAAARLAGFQAERAELAARFIASFFNAIVAALLLAALYTILRLLRVSSRASFAAALLLGFTTPMWVSAKSFACEPVEALGMLLALGGGARAGAASTPAEQRRAEVWAGIGAFLAVFVKLGVTPMVFACLAAIGYRRPRAWIVPMAWVAAAFMTHAFYNWMRFGNMLETGYGSQQSFEAFSTPLLVGAYGLLLSSGKGVAWFATMTWLVPSGVAAMVRSRQHSEAAKRGDDVRHAGWAIVLAWTVGVVTYGQFEHWGGDGSWGPRYLVPLLPLAAVAVGFALDGASKARKRLAWLLALVGLIVTLGGVTIYFGAQMREARIYPYDLNGVPLSDPHFMESSHWNPRYSPIFEHWRMLQRNLGEHLRGESPSFGREGDVDARIGISRQDEAQLTHTIDLWWLYAGYAGIPTLPLGAAAIALLFASIWAWSRAWHAVREDSA